MLVFLCSIIFHLSTMHWISKYISSKRYRTGKDRDESDGIYLIRFMEASYVVRFTTYRSVGRLVDRGLNSVPELLLISMPLCQKRKRTKNNFNRNDAKRTLTLPTQIHNKRDFDREKKKNGLACILCTRATR